MRFNIYLRGPLMEEAAAATGGTTLPPVDPQVTNLQNEINNQKRTIDELKRRVAAPPQTHQPPAAPQPQLDPKEMNRQFYSDPIQSTIAIAQGVANRAMNNPELAGQRETLIQVAKDSIRNRNEEDRKLWDKYLLEIEATAAQAGPQFQSNINVWENAFKMVKGNHIDEILADRGQTSSAVESPRAPAVHIKSGGGPDVPSARAAAAPRGEELSPEEKRTARKLGITEQAYKDGKKAIEEQNDPVSDPVGKSSWDSLITFDSKERRRKLREAAQKRGAA